MRHNSYKKGSWNVVCDVCGFKFKATQIKRRWDGLLVCHDDWEPRHSLDFLRGRHEDISVPFVNSEADAEITITTSPTTVTVTLLNTGGLPMVGVTPTTFSSDTHVATVGNPLDVTDSNGQCQFVITPVSVGSTNINVSYGGLTSNTIRFEVAGS